MRHAPLHRCVVYTVIYQGIGRNTAPYETTYTYNPSDARAARALCGDDGRAERVPRDKDPLELKAIRAVGYSYCLMRCGYMHMYGFRNIITTHTCAHTLNNTSLRKQIYFTHLGLGSSAGNRAANGPRLLAAAKLELCWSLCIAVAAGAARETSGLTRRRREGPRQPAPRWQLPRWPQHEPLEAGAGAHREAEHPPPLQW